MGLLIETRAGSYHFGEVRVTDLIVDSPDRIATIDDESMTGHIIGSLRGEIYDCTCQVLRLAKSAHGNQINHKILIFFRILPNSLR
jgi:hypothetical protein